MILIGPIPPPISSSFSLFPMLSAALFPALRWRLARLSPSFSPVSLVPWQRWDIYLLDFFHIYSVISQTRLIQYLMFSSCSSRVPDSVFWPGLGNPFESRREFALCTYHWPVRSNCSHLRSFLLDIFSTFSTGSLSYLYFQTAYIGCILFTLIILSSVDVQSHTVQFLISTKLGLIEIFLMFLPFLSYPMF